MKDKKHKMRLKMRKKNSKIKTCTNIIKMPLLSKIRIVIFFSGVGRILYEIKKNVNKHALFS